MDWSSVIIDALSVTTILGVVATIRFWKQTKELKDKEVKLKESEVQTAEVETQSAGIDLVSKYRDEMFEMMNMVKEANEKNFSNQGEILESIRELKDKTEKLDTRMESIEEKVNRMDKKVDNMESFLDGPYHRYVADKEMSIDN